MEKIYISGFSDEIDKDLDQQLKKVRELGLDYISIRGIGDKNIADYSLEEFQTDIYPKLQENKIGISSIGSPIGKIFIDDDEAFDKQKEILKNLCQIANLTQTKYIRIFSFYIDKEKNPDDYKNQVLEKLKVFIDIASDYGLVLVHENEKDIYGDSLKRCLDLAENLYGDNFKLIFDFANFVQVGQEPREAYEKLKDYVDYIHIKDAIYNDNQNVVCGSGDGQIEEILRDLMARGYEGFLTLEPHLVQFDSLKSLELEDVSEIIKEDKAENGFEGFKMQLEALTNILNKIGG